jgi:FixJ family two-component response regulator
VTTKTRSRSTSANGALTPSREESWQTLNDASGPCRCNMNTDHHAMAEPHSSLIRTTPTVFVVDESLSVRRSAELLITAAGWRPRIFASAEEFLAYPRVLAPSCLILDATLPDLSGLQIQELIGERVEMPIIFMTEAADVGMAVRAMKAGALEFLMKPCEDARLLTAIRGALERSRAALSQDAWMRGLRRRYSSLTTRERDVIALLVEGNLNKQIGGTLGISEVTVKSHRGRVMRKMAAGSLPELVSMAVKLGLCSAQIDVRGTADERRSAHRMLEYHLLNAAS